MPLTCAICKKPIGPHDMWAKVSGRVVHVGHNGVVEHYGVKPDDVHIGQCEMRRFPVRLPRSATK